MVEYIGMEASRIRVTYKHIHLRHVNRCDIEGYEVRIREFNKVNLKSTDCV